MDRKVDLADLIQIDPMRVHVIDSPNSYQAYKYNLKGLPFNPDSHKRAFSNRPSELRSNYQNSDISNQKKQKRIIRIKDKRLEMPAFTRPHQELLTKRQPSHTQIEDFMVTSNSQLQDGRTHGRDSQLTNSQQDKGCGIKQSEVLVRTIDLINELLPSEKIGVNELQFLIDMFIIYDPSGIQFQSPEFSSSLEQYLMQNICQKYAVEKGREDELQNRIRGLAVQFQIERQNDQQKVVLMSDVKNMTREIRLSNEGIGKNSIHKKNSSLDSYTNFHRQQAKESLKNTGGKGSPQFSRPKTQLDFDKGSEQLEHHNQDDQDQNPAINDIIVKIEMKKFQNLVEKKLKRKNHLTQNDILCFYPMNKIEDGSAQFVHLDNSFKSQLYKINPRLFKQYEKINKRLEEQQAIQRYNSMLPMSKQLPLQNEEPKEEENPLASQRKRQIYNLSFDSKKPSEKVLHEGTGSVVSGGFGIGQTNRSHNMPVKQTSLRQNASMLHKWKKSSLNNTSKETFQGVGIIDQKNKSFLDTNRNSQQQDAQLLQHFPKGSKFQMEFVQHPNYRTNKNPPDLSYLSHQNNYQSTTQRQRITGDNTRQLMQKHSKEPDQSFRLRELKTNPYYQQLYATYKEQQSQYQNELSRILHEYCQDRNPKKRLKSEPPQEYKKPTIVNGQLVRGGSKDLVDPLVLEKVRRQQDKFHYGTRLQKLCYAVPTFKEKLFELPPSANNYNF